MKKYIFFLLFFCFKYASAQLLLTSKTTVPFGPGTRIKAELKLNDVSLMNDFNLNLLIGQSIKEKVYFFSCLPFTRHSTSGDFISEVDVIFTGKYKNESELEFSFMGKSLKLFLNGFQFDPKIQAAKGDPEFVNTRFSLESLKSWYGLFFALIFLPLGYIGFKYFLKRRNLIKRKKEWNKYLNQIVEARDRDQFEKIWYERELIRKKWEKVLPFFNEYWSKLNTVQFKPNWGQDDKKLITHEHEKLISELRKYDGI